MGKQRKIFNAFFAMTVLLSFAGSASCQQHQLRIKAGYWYYGDFPYYPSVAIEKLLASRVSLSLNGLILWRPGITDQDRFFDWTSSLQGRYYVLGKPKSLAGYYWGGNLQMEQVHLNWRSTHTRITRTKYIATGLTMGLQVPIYRRFSFQAEAGLIWTILGQRKIYGITGELTGQQTISRTFSPQLTIQIGYLL